MKTADLPLLSNQLLLTLPMCHLSLRCSLGSYYGLQTRQLFHEYLSRSGIGREYQRVGPRYTAKVSPISVSLQ